MGIYSNGIIYGVSIKFYNENDEDFILYEEKYNEVISVEEKKKLYDILLTINMDDLTRKYVFKIYTLVSSTYGSDHYLAWYPTSYNELKIKLN
jgi:hypothetical protein